MGKYLIQLAVVLAAACCQCQAMESESSDQQQVYQHTSNGRVQGAYIIEEPIIAAGNDKNFQSVVIVETGTHRRFEPRPDEIFLNKPTHNPIGHQLFGSQQLDRLLLGDDVVRAPSPKTQDVGHRLFGSQQLDKLLQASAAKPPALRTYDVGHKLFGDRQFGQLQASDPSDKTIDDTLKTAAAQEILADKTASRINVERYEDPSFPESAPSVEIDAIVRQPKGEESRAEPGVPSGRRLVSSKAYELAPSALPLVSGLPHDSAHLQILSEIPYRIYIHPPKVYPITPSPELSGPLLGGPRLVANSAEKKVEVKKNRPYYGRAMEQGRRMQEEVERARTFQEYYFQPMMSYPMVRPGYRGNLFPAMERKYNAYYPYRQ